MDQRLSTMSIAPLTVPAKQPLKEARAPEPAPLDRPASPAPLASPSRDEFRARVAEPALLVLAIGAVLVALVLANRFRVPDHRDPRVTCEDPQLRDSPCEAERPPKRVPRGRTRSL